MRSPKIDWQEKYNPGSEDIDLQHHYFVRLNKRLSEDSLKLSDQDFKAALVAELNAYVRFHFSSQDHVMRRAGYPL